MHERAGLAPLHVCDSGHGPVAIVFLHYFGGSGRAWAQVAALLGERWHCVMPDLRGFGESDALPSRFNTADAAGDVLDVIQALGLRQYMLVGHSMGGKIALAMAAQQPVGLTHLVLLAPSPPTPEPIKSADRAQMLSSQHDRAAAEKTTRLSCAQVLPKALFNQAVADRLRTSPGAWRWWLEQGSREDISHALPTIGVPCQVLVGALDSNIPPPLVQTEVMPHLLAGKLRIVPQAGHLLPLEVPQTVAQAIRDFASEG